MNFLTIGFLLGLAYVAPIGMQNLYVINTAISEKLTKALIVSWIVVFFDITLAIACFLGFGSIMEQFLVIKNIVLIIGSIAIIYIGFNLIKTRIDTLSSVDIEKSLLKTIATSFLVTWANPQAIIDGTLLLGSYKLVLNGSEDLFFIIGVCIASFSWFTILSFLVNTMKKGFTPKIVNMINILSGSIIIIYGIKLGYEFIKTII